MTGRLPVTPVVSGSPVQLVSVPLAGVPRIAPLPSVATPVTPSVLENVPVVAATVDGVVAPSVPFNAPPVMVGLVSVLLVSVSVVALPTNVSVASGNVSVRATVGTEASVKTAPVVEPLGSNRRRFVSSKPS